MKRLLFQAVKYILLLTVCIAIGAVMIFSVYSIPTELMLDNVKSSVATFEREGEYYLLLDTENSRLDNFTDAFMVNDVIATQGKGIVDDAMKNYRYSKEGYNNIEILEGVLNGEELGAWSYGRYWHGYLVFLKPLFVLFNYAELRWLNVIGQIVLMGGILYVLHQRKLTRYCVPLVAAWFAICPPAIMLSLQFSAVFYITFVSSLLILFFKEFFDKGHYSQFFLVIGAATSYFDMLTYPMLTVLIPLTIVFVMRDAEHRSWYKPLLDIVTYGLSWCIGYIGMWMGKWCIASLLTDTNYIHDAINSVFLRTSHTTYDSSVVPITSGLKNSLDVLLIRPVPYALGACVFVCMMLLLKHYRRIRLSVTTIYPYILLTIAPAVWLIITCNHSNVHCWFTFRNLAASIFSLLCGILALIDKQFEG